MTNGIDYLRNAKQNYIQFDVMLPINLSKTVFNFAQNGVPKDEYMMIYKGWAPTIEISSREEYERFKAVNCDSDYRAYENGLLFCTNDIGEIETVVKSVLDYYMYKDYEATIDGMIMALSPKKTLELEK